jgi:cellulose synthase/poly-beta-1,6-N-acetylglucosamine synthase-like glycosyltransferase
MFDFYAKVIIIPILEHVINILGAFMSILGNILKYRFLFLAVGLFCPSKKFKPTDKQYKYAVLIAARNEENVIGPCLESIKKQDYPLEKLTVFVIAHNCTDKTAEIARNNGATVVEYNNKKQRRKGYALKYLLEHIRCNYAQTEEQNGILNFDGYFIVDADTLLETNYVTEMNKAFAQNKYAVITSYCDIKNFNTSCISAYEGTHYISSNISYRKPLSLLGLGQTFCGTGILIQNNVLQNGWQWLLLADDNQLSIDLIARGYRIGYCEAAKYYDEVPPNIFLLGRRMSRFGWASFHCFIYKLPTLFLGLILTFDWDKKFKPKNKQKETVFSYLLKKLSIINIIIMLVPTNTILGLLLLNTIITIIIATFIYGGQMAFMMFYSVVLGNIIWLSVDSIYIFCAAIHEIKRIRLSPCRFLFWIILYLPISYLRTIFYQFGGILPNNHKPIRRYVKTTLGDVHKEKTLIQYFQKTKS